MKRHNYILKIDNPCGQDWRSMTRTNIGHFCSHCSKTVIDLAQLTDNEILRIIEQTSGKFCGRLTQQQLNRVLEIRKPTNNKRLYKILAGLLLAGQTESAFATERIPDVQTEIVNFSDNKNINEQQVTTRTTIPADSLKNVIQGVVIDNETRKPVPFAVILIKETKRGISADENGKFKMVIPEKLRTDTIHVEISLVGYRKMEFSMRKTELPVDREFIIVPDDQLIFGEVEIIEDKKSRRRKQKSCH